MGKADLDILGDLILNESFLEFVENSNPESVRTWNEWIANNPDKKTEVENAAFIIKALLNKGKARVPYDKKESLQRLLMIIDEEKKQPEKRAVNITSVWLRVAAVGLIVLGLSSLLYVFRADQGNKKGIAYNEIIVPLGEKAQIVLSDGSHVWINSDSKLRYPVQFGSVSREVTLVGEAFFDVKKNHGKTFIVNTNDAKVNVLGTAFNVRCYPDDKKTQTTVVRGSVEVEERNGSKRVTVLKPNEMATITCNDPDRSKALTMPPIAVKKVDANVLVSWKDQLLVFAGEPLEDLAVKMERWYNVKIRIDNEKLKSERFSGKFVHNETIYQVLEAIKITTPIAYRVENDTIVLSRK